MGNIEIADFIKTYINSAVVIFGVIANTVILIVLLRPRLRTKTTSLYLGVLAAVDTSILVFSSIENVFDASMADSSQGACMTLLYLPVVLLTLEPWILVNFSLERLTLAYFPERREVWFSHRRALLGLGVTLAGCLAFYVPALTEAILRPDPEPETNGTLSCSLSRDFTDNHLTIWAAFDLFLSTILPFAILLGTSLAIARRLMTSPRPPDDPEVTHILVAGKALSRSLVAVSLVFILLNLPLTICLIFASAVDDLDLLIQESDTTFWVLRTLSETLVLVNSAVNIFFYPARQSDFRRECRAIASGLYHACAVAHPIISCSCHCGMTSKVGVRIGSVELTARSKNPSAPEKDNHREPTCGTSGVRKVEPMASEDKNEVPHSCRNHREAGGVGGHHARPGSTREAWLEKY